MTCSQVAAKYLDTKLERKVEVSSAAMTSLVPSTDLLKKTHYWRAE